MRMKILFLKLFSYLPGQSVKYHYRHWYSCCGTFTLQEVVTWCTRVTFPQHMFMWRHSIYSVAFIKQFYYHAFYSSWSTRNKNNVMSEMVSFNIVCHQSSWKNIWNKSHQICLFIHRRVLVRCIFWERSWQGLCCVLFKAWSCRPTLCVM